MKGRTSAIRIKHGEGFLELGDLLIGKNVGQVLEVVILRHRPSKVASGQGERLERQAIRSRECFQCFQVPKVLCITSRSKQAPNR